ncbi:hypothetical protein DNTS_001809, partial [Danionella cerebrum]
MMEKLWRARNADGSVPVHLQIMKRADAEQLIFIVIHHFQTPDQLHARLWKDSSESQEADEEEEEATCKAVRRSERLLDITSGSLGSQSGGVWKRARSPQCSCAPPPQLSAQHGHRKPREDSGATEELSWPRGPGREEQPTHRGRDEAPPALRLLVGESVIVSDVKEPEEEEPLDEQSPRSAAHQEQG